VHEIACASYREVPSSDIYLCGPPAMVASARAELLMRGAAPERIHHD
jgi:NAD(P)H-flavin reductase